MSEIEMIFERSNIHSLCYYMMYGVEPLENITMNFEEREREAYDTFEQILLEEVKDREKPIFSELANLLDNYQSVYMEMGVIVGMKLASVKDYKI